MITDDDDAELMKEMERIREQSRRQWRKMAQEHLERYLAQHLPPAKHKVLKSKIASLALPSSADTSQTSSVGDTSAKDGSAWTENHFLAYEYWLADLHPENSWVKNGSLSEGSIDHRFYLSTSEHLSIWNSTCRRRRLQHLMVQVRAFTILSAEDALIVSA